MSYSNPIHPQFRLVREVNCILYNRANCKMCQTFRMYKRNTLCQSVTTTQGLISIVKLRLQPCMCVCAHTIPLAKQQRVHLLNFICNFMTSNSINIYTNQIYILSCFCFQHFNEMRMVVVGDATSAGRYGACTLFIVYQASLAGQGEGRRRVKTTHVRMPHLYYKVCSETRTV